MIDSNQYEKYEKIALFIQPNIHKNLIATYEKYIRGKKPELYIDENYIKTTKPLSRASDTEPSSQDKKDSRRKSVSLEDIITVCTYIALSKENIEQSIRTYRENRRVYKRNWFNSIKEEMGPPEKMRPKNPRLLRKYAESTSLINNMDRSQDDDRTIEEIMLDKYNEIDNWRSDTTAPITDFSFTAQKPTKTLANAFINDITFESLLIIKDAFGGSIEGFNTKYPTEFNEHPLFSFRSTVMDFEPQLLENELTFFNQYSYKDEDKGIEGDITVKYNPDVDLPSTVTEKNLSKIMKEFQINLKQRELDMKDREIMTQLFNLINGETLSTQHIRVDLREFTRRVFNIRVPKKKHYEDIGNRLEKLKNYDYTITVRSRETGELIETTSLGLLNYLYINFQENYFQYTPSEQWIRTYVQKKYITDSYKSVDSPQTKGIMMILQQERLTEYAKNSYTKTLPLNYFRLHMKLQKIGNAALVKELTNHMSILKSEQIVIKDFEFINK
ncbi:hypothetical protein, partial [Phocaeicola sartorii]|uniref:hypothetical protein n=1 Tax=Phocaeicola sartorii TaxID=671267 RepID=UPI002596C96E